MKATRVTDSEFQHSFHALSDKAMHEPVVITKGDRDSLVVMAVPECTPFGGRPEGSSVCDRGRTKTSPIVWHTQDPRWRRSPIAASCSRSEPVNAEALRSAQV